MHLVAPSIPTGSTSHFLLKIQGGGLNGQHLNEINGPNHYIGMKPIQVADFMEMRWMPFVSGRSFCSHSARLCSARSNVVDLFALDTRTSARSRSARFGIGFTSNGHNLDPHARVHINRSRQCLIGAKQIANFREASHPMAGAYPLLPLRVALSLMAGWSLLQKGDKRMSTDLLGAQRLGVWFRVAPKRTFAVFIASLVLLAGEKFAIARNALAEHARRVRCPDHRDRRFAQVNAGAVTLQERIDATAPNQMIREKPAFMLAQSSLTNRSR